MSASEEQVNSFAKRGASLASKLVGAVAGAAIGTSMAGPVGSSIGAAAGVFLEFQFSRALGEFASRQLTERQAARAGAGIILFEQDLLSKFKDGAKIRNDGFFGTGEFEHGFSHEYLEHAIVAMMDAIEERKIPFLSKFFSNVLVRSDLDRGAFPNQVQVLSSLSYRDICILKAVSEKRSKQFTARPDNDGDTEMKLPVETLCRDVFRLFQTGLVVSQTDKNQFLNSVAGFDDVDPVDLHLTKSGQLMYDYLELVSLDSNDSEYANCLKLLHEISNVTANSYVIDGGTF